MRCELVALNGNAGTVPIYLLGLCKAKGGVVYCFRNVIVRIKIE